MSDKVAIIGYGYVGKAYHKMFPDAVVYDEPRKICRTTGTFPPGIGSVPTNGSLDTLTLSSSQWLQDARMSVNGCDLAIVCVPTNLLEEQLDMSIVEDVITWLETPLILIKSALQPGTTDSLVKAYKKKIAVSVEMVGEGNYFTPYWKYPDTTDPTKHSFLIIGGEEDTARRCADILWSRMSPDINIHLVSAVEAEITKLMENTWGAMKVTFANTIYDICEGLGANYTKVLQAWGADGRTEKMHMRVLPNKRGWRSKCFDKDIPALGSLDKSGFINNIIKVNGVHLNENIDR